MEAFIHLVLPCSDPVLTLCPPELKDSLMRVSSDLLLSVSTLRGVWQTLTTLPVNTLPPVASVGTTAALPPQESEGERLVSFIYYFCSLINLFTHLLGTMCSVFPYMHYFILHIPKNKFHCCYSSNYSIAKQVGL